jgi:hypothetical protein
MRSKFVIVRDFTDGYAAGVTNRARLLSESDDWLAGYDAGYPIRHALTGSVNAHLMRLGIDPVKPIGFRSHQSAQEPQR